MSSVVALPTAQTEQPIRPTVASSSRASSRKNPAPAARAGSRNPLTVVPSAALVDRSPYSRGVPPGPGAAGASPAFGLRSLTPNRADMIRLAAGAAVSAPKPPASKVVTIT